MKQRSQLGFTLVELMISVVIIGVLASIGITSYQKYIVKSKLSEGTLQLRELHDRQVLYANTPLTINDATYGIVQCRPTQRFATACMQINNNDGEGFGFYIPSMVKANERRWYGRSVDAYNTNYNPTTGTCSGNGITNYTDPKFIFFGGEYATSRNDRFLWVDSNKSYFTLWTWHNRTLARALPGVPRRDTNMVWALADLDGDFDNSSLSGNANVCNDEPRNLNGITILGRSIYYQNGEIVSGANILSLNPGE